MSESKYPKLDLNIYVLIKQVPIPKAMKTTAEGLMDRTGKSQMNPHCSHALEEAISLKDKVGGTITIVSMGPPNAKQSLNEALRRGADRAYLLSDRKLAGSDTWSTAEALSKTIQHISNGDSVDVLFAGLQTIDGDTAHVGPQCSARLGLNQVTYVESVDIFDNKTLKVRRIIESGYQILKVPLPTMLSVSHTANVPRGPSLTSSMSALKKEIIIFNIDEVGLPVESAGMTGSPTVVSKVKNVVHDRDNVVLFVVGTTEDRVSNLLKALKEEAL
jgi:electron transfer flavoprotein alpha/beta subunit